MYQYNLYSLFQAIATAIQTDSEDDTPLKALVDIADAAHKYLRPYLAPTLELCYKVCYEYIIFSCFLLIFSVYIIRFFALIALKSIQPALFLHTKLLQPTYIQ